jgi:catechol 2,3-dioxygenase-like lactoylglutathione lyase family enzyme
LSLREEPYLMPHPSISQQITFLHAQDLTATSQFYTKTLGLAMVRDQGSCRIFQVTESAFLGFCEHIEPSPPGRKVILTLVSDQVDEWYQTLKQQRAELMDSPKANPKYQIYHFFLKDPNGYWIEIQHFEQPL